MGPMRFQSETDCRKCQGEGEIIIQKCSICNGNKNTEHSKEINVTIPPGIKPEHTIIERNAGHDIENVVSDLKINIEERPHNFYKRQDLDIKCNITISLLEALTGFQKEFTLLDGSKITFQTNNITKPHTKLYLKGHGFVNVQNQSQRGNLICGIHIEFPNKLEHEWLEKLINNSQNKKYSADNNKFDIVIEKN
jgi:DnaJ-class molecular chaperone